MIRIAVLLAAFVSLFCFPWPLTVFLTLSIAYDEPLVPLAVGMCADALYFAAVPGSYWTMTVCGALATIISYWVRKRVHTSIIR